MTIEKKSLIRLNKFISNSGICTRREADELIKKGLVKVNGKMEMRMGASIDPSADKVMYQGSLLHGDLLKYILLNKTKGYGIGGRDVSRLLTDSSLGRLFPIGQLTTEETGLILFTNDPEAQKRIQKSKESRLFLYHITLSHPAEEAMINTMKMTVKGQASSLLLGDVALVETEGQNELGLSTNCYDTRVLRGLIRAAGGNVVRLDRVIYAGITKKDIPRGKWRVLSLKEAAFLRMI